jgi:hypothetical protein
MNLKIDRLTAIINQKNWKWLPYNYRYAIKIHNFDSEEECDVFFEVDIYKTNKVRKLPFYKKISRLIP